MLKDASVYYNPKAEEMPDGDVLSLFEALGLERLVFPKGKDLVKMELELLTIALHFLFGKGYHSEHFVAWPLERQYLEFVAHWSRWGKVDGSERHLIFKMLPQKISIYDKVRKPSRFKSESEAFMKEMENRKDDDDGADLPF